MDGSVPAGGVASAVQVESDGTSRRSDTCNGRRIGELASGCAGSWRGRYGRGRLADRERVGGAGGGAVPGVVAVTDVGRDPVVEASLVKRHGRGLGRSITSSGGGGGGGGGPGGAVGAGRVDGEIDPSRRVCAACQRGGVVEVAARWAATGSLRGHRRLADAGGGCEMRGVVPADPIRLVPSDGNCVCYGGEGHRGQDAADLEHVADLHRQRPLRAAHGVAGDLAASGGAGDLRHRRRHAVVHDVARAVARTFVGDGNRPRDRRARGARGGGALADREVDRLRRTDRPVVVARRGRPGIKRDEGEGGGSAWVGHAKLEDLACLVALEAQVPVAEGPRRAVGGANGDHVRGRVCTNRTGDEVDALDHDGRALHRHTPHEPGGIGEVVGEHTRARRYDPDRLQDLGRLRGEADLVDRRVAGAVHPEVAGLVECAVVGADLLQSRVARDRAEVCHGPGATYLQQVASRVLGRLGDRNPVYVARLYVETDGVVAPGRRRSDVAELDAPGPEDTALELGRGLLREEDGGRRAGERRRRSAVGSDRSSGLRRSRCGSGGRWGCGDRGRKRRCQPSNHERRESGTETGTNGHQPPRFARKRERAGSRSKIASHSAQRGKR